MMYPPRRLASFALLGILACSGCGAPQASPLNADTAHLKVVGLLYGQFLAENRGAPPANQDQFVAYLEREPANWDKLASTAEALITQSRNGSKLVVLYGPEAKSTEVGTPAVAAYEASGSAEQLVVDARGGVHAMDQASIDALFSQP